MDIGAHRVALGDKMVLVVDVAHRAQVGIGWKRVLQLPKRRLYCNGLVGLCIKAPHRGRLVLAHMPAAQEGPLASPPRERSHLLENLVRYVLLSINLGP